MQFKDPWILLLLPLAALGVYLLKRAKHPAAIRFSWGELLKSSQPTFKLYLAQNIIFLRAFIVCLFVFALARPRMPLEETKVKTEGIDIILAIDASGSMLAEDFKVRGQRQNRLEAVKTVVQDFIAKRKSDRIAMVAFAARAYTVCPLTLDYDWLLENLKRVEIGAIEDGTAIGSAIASSLSRLKDSEAKSKIIILLTDGVNNRGEVTPQAAAQIAKGLGIKVYTIGAGTKGTAPFPVQGFWGRKMYQQVKVEIDETTLREIAKETGGQYYRATDTESLRRIYDEIDSLEKSKIEEAGFQEYKELFPVFLIPALLLLILEIGAANTILRQTP